MKTLTRRRFITTSSQATAVIAAGSSVLGFPRIASSQSPGDQIVLALIGAGGRAASHSAGLSRLPGVEFTYVCDVWKDRGAGIMQDLANAQKRAPKRIADMRAALDDKDVNTVVIVTPEHWHALATVWACQAGKDVYVEKNPSIANRVRQKQLVFGAATERFTNSDAANALLKPAYRKQYRIPEPV